MKIIEKIEQAQKDKHISYSFEYFPPKTELGFANLVDRLGRMSQLEPEFISCTWGAGGSTHDRTLELCSTAQSLYGLDTLMHLTCTNMEKEKVDIALKQAKEAGIRNILALRGDPPRGHEYWIPVDSHFTHAIDLVKYIRQEYKDYFCIGVAGYPEGHIDCADKEQDMTYLKEKVDAGADFIMTQLFYDSDICVAWIQKCRERGINVPIVPGIMPIPTYHSFRRMINLCNVKVPAKVMQDLDAIKGDDQKVKEYGVKLAVSMIQHLYLDADICNFHISTLNLERSTRLILEALHLHTVGKSIKAGKVSPWAPISDPSRAELWDEFPNGRYGDSRSPAYGEVTHSAGQILSTSQASLKWGQPELEKDIQNLFIKYIRGEINSLPWCDESLGTETGAIYQRLCEINERGYWTVSSQPAVNGASSQDAVYGWGPKGGYVYQKAFLEFFVSDTQIEELLVRLTRDDSITFYATNQKGDFRTNVSDADEAQNAVTWGVFPGKEIIQPTIIEKASFEAWKDDAFELWKEWEEQYAPNSKSQKLLHDIGQRYWLVNVVHNDFQQPDLLFDVMLSK
ncbi:methylenetetrahydrofolate reductase-domain-containing protein [Helicostylum pulchrum]|uniref:MTHFR SAM-binding regulatory domain-containing protein n=1 Tax=Helicostylum pulchrum TaxID=562976 RepID=A0ABP9Y9H2_9FUNG|nr:methylenetetrahydrofolate reductase-domain-containing protein [Helicostylum pulchrum]